MRYLVFKRSARNFEEFARADKIPVQRHCSYGEAVELCKEYNNNRSYEDEHNGTKLEFQLED